ncbi:uncharacterized protein LOC124936779 [Impatiens glandulifera]|uniref:uncharacterized protein LOC124936779 n=1 Tax=Impatiens glandulifera TaxID=253017 RepID=UPI001FB0DE60|nr:uncharacterized protein LOC124936779 [Impatiens glandulifera]
MKTFTLLSPSSSSKSDDDHRSESQISSYFPGCRKDATCKCDMCLASISATLDIKSTHKRNLTKLPTSKKPNLLSPIPFNPSLLSSPRSVSTKLMVPPPLDSFRDSIKKNKRDFRFGVFMMRTVLVLGLVLSAEFGFSPMVSRFFRPTFSPDLVRDSGERSSFYLTIDKKLGFLKRDLGNLVKGNVFDCRRNDSVWRISQDDLILNSRCVLYKSAMEEVNIWGWPLQTAGLLTAEFSSRSFTILSGRVTQWSDGKMIHYIRRANSSWVQEKWSASAVQLDPGTWILEHRQSAVMENPKLISTLVQFMSNKLLKTVKAFKKNFWLSATGINRFGEDVIIPT